MYHKIIRFLGAGLGLGYLPLAPGTFGTLLGCVFFYVFRFQSQEFFVKMTLGVVLVSIVMAHLAEKIFKTKDCQKIVIDEVAGVLVCYAFVGYSVYHLVLGFLLFRLFDVAKIFPARWCQDHLGGGLGIVGDDVIAGLQGGVILKYLPLIVTTVKNIL
jgi:phosphatidylglycerophosphatase A